MKTFIYLDSFHSFSHNAFIEQLVLYNRISEVCLIDNSLDETERNQFLSELSGYELDDVEYIINDSHQTFGAAANQNIYQSYTEILIVSPGVCISEEDIREMKRIYDLSEHHKFVIPRTNDGHYQTLPVDRFLYGKQQARSTRQECKKMAEVLPDFCIMPWIEDCCVLMDGNRPFDIMGFHPDYLTMSAALKSFSISMANYGYNTVAANHAYAEYVKEEKHEDREKLDEYNLLLQHKELMKILEIKYQQCFLLPQDYFAKLIADQERKKKILYFIPHIVPEYNGSAVHSLMLLQGLYARCPEHWEMDVVISKQAEDFFGLEQKYSLKFMEMEDIDGIYDLAFAPFHIFSPSQLERMKKHAMKLVGWPLDIISDRSNYLSGAHNIKLHDEFARCCDGLIYFSQETKKDYELFYGSIENISRIPSMVSYIVPQPLREQDCGEELPYEEYYLMFGNRYLHKMIDPALEQMKNTEYNFIIVGGSEPGFVSPNIYSYPSGQLQEEMIAKLFHNCRALIFPSIYEGFGLPVLQALNAGKNVYLMESKLNHELESLEEGFHGHIFYMNSLYELRDILKRTEQAEAPAKNLYTRSWEEVAQDCIAFLDRIMQQENDYDKMTARWRLTARN